MLARFVYCRMNMSNGPNISSNIQQKFVGPSVGQFCVLSNEHVKWSQHFMQHPPNICQTKCWLVLCNVGWTSQTVPTFCRHLDRTRLGKQSSLVLKIFKAFTLYNTHAPSRTFVVGPCQTYTTENRYIENNRNVGLMSGQCLFRMKLHPTLTQHKKSAPDIVGSPCQTLPIFDPTNVGCTLGEMSRPFWQGLNTYLQWKGRDGPVLWLH